MSYPSSLARDGQRPSPPSLSPPNSRSVSSSYLDPLGHTSSVSTPASRSFTTLAYRSPSPLPSVIDLPPVPSPSSYSNPHRSFAHMPPPSRPAYARSPSSTTSPSTSRTTFERIVQFASTLKHKASGRPSPPPSPYPSSKPSPRKPSVPQEGDLPTVWAKAGAELTGGRKGWQRTIGDTLWWAIFWTCVVIYLRALAGFGAQDTVLWEERQPAVI